MAAGLIILARLPDGSYELHSAQASGQVVKRLGDMVRNGRWVELYVAPACRGVRN